MDGKRIRSLPLQKSYKIIFNALEFWEGVMDKSKFN